MTGATMPRNRDGACRVEGCDRQRVRGAFLCEQHLGDKRRCEGVVKTVDPDTGEVTTRRCRSSAMHGLLVCRMHGGNGPVSTAVSQRTSALTAMQRFVKPYDGQLDAVTAFELEFRRTYGRILWLEDQIAHLADEQALIFGVTKVEKTTAGEYPGTTTTYEARVHVFEEMLRFERKHFLELEKTWIRANLDERKLSMMRDHITYTYAKVTEAARALGHDPDDEATRDVLMRLFSDGRTPAAEVAAAIPAAPVY